MIASPMGRLGLAVLLAAGLLSLNRVGAAQAQVQRQQDGASTDLPGARPEGRRAGRKDGQKGGRNEGQERGQGGREPRLPADLQMQQALHAVLVQPTDRSITVSVLADRALEVWIEYAIQDPSQDKPMDLALDQVRWQSTPVQALQPGEPAQWRLSDLLPDQAYRYRLRHRTPGASVAQAAPVQQFRTQRAPGRSFSFQVQGDSHPERPHQFDAGLYASTLRAAAAQQPDFYVLMGDDFSIDTLPVLSAESVTRRYALQRPYLSLIGQTASLFLVNGNHEQLAGYLLDGSADNAAVWAQRARERFYPMPVPDGFYSGNPEQVPHIGLLRNYYAWTWGDALFVVIDPYWYSQGAADTTLREQGRKGAKGQGRDLWNNTLGDAQYQWLRQTLEGSRARYKFVFAHHVLGTGRGGVQQAGLYEWGGRNRRGQDEFRQRRPGWPEPIHALMVRTGVNIFFQGHDHVFAREVLDGLVYQTVPEPADASGTLYFAEAYPGAELWPSPGRVRVHVDPQRVRVEYLRSTADGQPNVPPVYSYEITTPRR